MGLVLQPGSTVFFDTAPFIYYFEDHPVYAGRVNNLLEAVYKNKAQLVTSIITYIEIITKPYQESEAGLVSKYRNFFTNSEYVSMYPVNLSVAEDTAFFRVKYKMRTPDAIQCAVARGCGADYVISNDVSWKRIRELSVYILDEL